MSFVTHKHTLRQSLVNEIMGMTPQFDYGEFGKVVFYRTYSRAKADGSMESWNDVVLRVMAGVLSIRKDWYIKHNLRWEPDDWDHYARGMALSLFHMEWLPPGRGLWAMGSDFVYERGSMALNNCGYKSITNYIGDDCHWVMDALMCGVGVGFSPERDDDLTITQPTGRIEQFVVQDTRESWCDSAKAKIDSWLYLNSAPLLMDYSKVRPEGLPIKGFGGLSSGPAPLQHLHEQIDEFMEMYINENDWYDSVLLKSDIVNAIGCCVVAGNVRRSAEIACGPVSDPVFLNLKNYSKYPHRESIGWMSNNSAMFEDDGDFDKLGEVASRIITRGEPGVINVKNMKYGRVGRPMGNLKYDKGRHFNPCQSYTNKVLTQNGLKNFGELQIGDIIWSKEGWTKVINFWSSGVKDVFRYRTTTGYVDLTKNHEVMVHDRWKTQIGEANCIDTLLGPPADATHPLNAKDIMAGLLIGDGNRENGKILLNIGEKDQDYFTSEISHLIYEPRDSILQQYHVNQVGLNAEQFVPLPERRIPEEYLTLSPNRVRSFLCGIYSANGSVKVDSNQISLTITSPHIRDSVQLMLASLGIKSSYCVYTEHKRDCPHGVYVCAEAYCVAISDHNSRKLFRDLINFIQKYKINNLNSMVDKYWKIVKTKYNYDIIGVEYLGQYEVFDCTVDNKSHTLYTNGFNVSNCGEQVLEDGELCTLAETCPTKCEDEAQWLRSCEYSAVYASTVTLLPTHRVESNSVMSRNRRIGVSIVDYSGWVARDGQHKVISSMNKGYDKVRQINQWVNSEAGIPEAIRVTTMKPGGTTPKLAGRPSGGSYPNFYYQIRRIRVAMNSPICKLMVDAGIPYEKDVASANTYVFEYPLFVNSKAKQAKDVSLWQQAMNLITLQNVWSDNAVSNTLNFRPYWSLRKVVESPFINLDAVDAASKQFDLDLRLFLESSRSEYKNSTIKLELVKEYGVEKLKIYVYDVGHEEDDLPAVLAAIMPHIKSASFLPISADGVYPQMPESGITEEEYHRRVAQIKLIDWSTLRNVESAPELYCTGDVCERPQ
jgi:ribonucleotide reductase alpha subunit